MAPDMQYTAIFIYAVDTLVDLPSEYPEFLMERKGFGNITVEQGLLHVVEDPWIAYRGAANHNSIHSISVECLHQFFGGGDIAVAYHRDVKPRIFFHTGYHFPILYTSVSGFGRER